MRSFATLPTEMNRVSCDERSADETRSPDSICVVDVEIRKSTWYQRLWKVKHFCGVYGSQPNSYVQLCTSSLHKVGYGSVKSNHAACYHSRICSAYVSLNMHDSFTCHVFTIWHAGGR